MKTKISLLLLLLSIFSYSQEEASMEAFTPKKGMIKVAIFYLDGEGKTFDMEYYTQKHMPMAKKLYGDYMVAWSVDKGLTGATAELPKTYIAIGYFYFENMDIYKKSREIDTSPLRDDVPNYTNIKPLLQVSEIQTVQ